MTLYEYYQSIGKPLPTWQQRAPEYERLGLGAAASYTGTGDQNKALLEALMKQNQKPASVPAQTTQQPTQSTQSTPQLADVSSTFTPSQQVEMERIQREQTLNNLYKQQVLAGAITPLDAQQQINKQLGYQLPSFISQFTGQTIQKGMDSFTVDANGQLVKKTTDVTSDYGNAPQETGTTPPSYFKSEWGSFFEQTPQGLLAVADPNILRKLQAGSLPSTSLELQTGFAKATELPSVQVPKTISGSILSNSTTLQDLLKTFEPTEEEKSIQKRLLMLEPELLAKQAAISGEPIAMETIQRQSLAEQQKATARAVELRAQLEAAGLNRKSQLELLERLPSLLSLMQPQSLGVETNPETGDVYSYERNPMTGQITINKVGSIGAKQMSPYLKEGEITLPDGGVAFYGVNKDKSVDLIRLTDPTSGGRYDPKLVDQEFKIREAFLKDERAQVFQVVNSAYSRLNAFAPENRNDDNTYLNIAGNDAQVEALVASYARMIRPDIARAADLGDITASQSLMGTVKQTLSTLLVDRKATPQKIKDIVFAADDIYRTSYRNLTLLEKEFENFKFNPVQFPKLATEEIKETQRTDSFTNSTQSQSLNESLLIKYGF